MKSNVVEEQRHESGSVPVAQSAKASVLVAMVGLDANTRTLVAAAAGNDRGPPTLRAPRSEPPGLARGASHGDLELVHFPDLESFRAALDRYPTRDAVLIAEASVLRKRRWFPPHVHVIGLVGPDLGAVSDLAADDFLRRPFDVAELAVRLSAAARRLATDQRTTTRGVLGGAMRTGQSGEVIVSWDSDSARVHLDHGRVAWVHRASRPVSIRSLLGDLGLEVDDATCRDVIEESRASRRHFADVVVEWGLVDAERMRGALHGYIVTQIGELLGQVGATATFVKEKRAFASAFAFEEHEVLGARRGRRIETRPEMPRVRPASVRPLPAAAPHAASAWFARASCIEDVLGCILVDPQSGETIERSGTSEEADDRIVWSLIASFVALGDDGGELLATARGATYLARAAPGATGIFVIRFDASRLSPAMARLLLARVD
ncbi:MAG: hypothetical protein U0414_44230 [Polyangiaceae bacterium]